MRIEEPKPGADRTLVVEDLSTIGTSRLCLQEMDDDEDYDRVVVQVKSVKVCESETVGLGWEELRSKTLKC